MSETIALPGTTDDRRLNTAGLCYETRVIRLVVPFNSNSPRVLNVEN